jgi:hypothetical protein|tara:strand:+ start:316 stop:522 length:207 start_codon:yes stop_codon:yes gene_type:complete
MKGIEVRCTAIIKSGKKKGQQCTHPAHVGYKSIVCLKHARRSEYDSEVYVAYRDKEIDYQEAMRRTKQ